MNKIGLGKLSILAAAMILAGCSGKESILTPGQTESDCDAAATNLGVCGSPKSIYVHRDKIKHIWFEEDQSYNIDKRGHIFNIETKEEVVPGVKPDDCANYYCPGCEDDGMEDGSGTGTSVSGYYKGANKNDDIRVKNQSLIIRTPQEQAVIRDLGFVQKIWVAPHENRAGDLVSAHEMYVVIRKPKWVIGEEAPKNVRDGVQIPSLITAGVLADEHNAVEKKELSNVYDFVSDTEPKGLEKIKQYIQRNQGEQK